MCFFYFSGQPEHPLPHPELVFEQVTKVLQQKQHKLYKGTIDDLSQKVKLVLDSKQPYQDLVELPANEQLGNKKKNDVQDEGSPTLNTPTSDFWDTFPEVEFMRINEDRDEGVSNEAIS